MTPLFVVKNNTMHATLVLYTMQPTPVLHTVYLTLVCLMYAECFMLYVICCILKKYHECNMSFKHFPVGQHF